MISFPFTLIFKYIFSNILLLYDIYLYLHFIKNLKYSLKINQKCLKEVLTQLQNDLYYNKLII